MGLERGLPSTGWACTLRRAVGCVRIEPSESRAMRMVGQS